MMTGRWTRLESTIEGFSRSGVSLVGWNGKWLPGEKGDDPLMYYVVPKLVSLGLSLKTSVAIFFSAFYVPFIVGFVCLYKLVKEERWGLIIMASYSLLCVMAIASQDLYLVLTSGVVGVLPLYWIRGGGVSFFLTSGVFLGLCELARSNAGMPVVVYFMLKKKHAITLGFLIPLLAMSLVVKKRDEFLKGKNYLTSGMHVFWHSLCIGTSFLGNEYGLPANDQEVIQKVRSVEKDAVFPSREYDLIARGLFLETVKNHPYFILRSMFAKAGVLFIYALFFGNLSLFKKPDLPYLAATAMASLPAFLVTPYHFYCLGFMAFTVFWGVSKVQSVPRE